MDGRERRFYMHCKDACDIFEEKKITNADKIRNMSDEELAQLISSGEWSAICPFCIYYSARMCRYDDDGNDTGSNRLCERGALEFLQSEAK